MQIFQTDSFTIRRLVQGDIDGFFDMQSNPNVMRYIKPSMTLEESMHELDRFIGYYTDDTIEFDIWAVIEKSSQEFIGICGVYKSDQSNYEIAYRLRESYWGRGVATEVAKGLIQYCFTNRSIIQLCAYARLGNDGSIRILERLMRFDKQFYSVAGKFEERYYLLNKSDWISDTSKVIETAIPADAGTLTELTIRSKAHWNYGAEQISKWLPDLTITETYIADGIVFKLVDSGLILGYYSLIHQSESEIKMDNLFIDPEQIGRGYGTRLLEDACRRARSLGYKSMTLDADPHAEQFYLAQGFKVIGHLPTSIEGRFLPVMEREL